MFLRPGLAAIALLTLDQATKALVRQHLAEGASIPVWGAVRLRRVANGRAMVVRAGAAAVLAWTAALAVLTALSAHPMLQSSLTQAGLGAALGGATGNLLDALRHRAVVDFVDLRIWPVFNLADVGIVAGIALVFAGVVG